MKKPRIVLWDGYVLHSEGNFFNYDNGDELCLDLESLKRTVPPGKYRLILESIPITKRKRRL